MNKCQNVLKRKNIAINQNRFLLTRGAEEVEVGLPDLLLLGTLVMVAHRDTLQNFLRRDGGLNVSYSRSGYVSIFT